MFQSLDYQVVPNVVEERADIHFYVEWKINQRSGETVELGKQDHALPS